MNRSEYRTIIPASLAASIMAPPAVVHADASSMPRTCLRTTATTRSMTTARKTGAAV